MPRPSTRPAVAAVVLLSLTAGCGGGAADGGGTSSAPKSGSAASSSNTGAQLDAGSVKQVLADYDRRNNSAITRSNAGDPSGWTAADSGALLEGDRYVTASSKALGEKSSEPSASRSAGHLGGTQDPDGQGQWLLVAERHTEKDSSGKPRAHVSYVGLEPGQGTHGWKAFHSTWTEGASRLPRADPAARVTPKGKQAVANAVSDAVYAVGNGSTQDFAFAPAVQDIRKFGYQDQQANPTTASYDCHGWGSRSGKDAATDSLLGTPAARLQRASAATVAAVSLDCEWSVTMPPGHETWLHPKLAKVMKMSSKPSTTMRRPVAVQMLLVVPDRGKPSIIGGSVRYLLPR